jgi:hypothetical protein
LIGIRGSRGSADLLGECSLDDGVEFQALD